ncbi:hypothetical protein BLOT_014016 [Blomia tropicalis]|nr:hypothetical protein BLOT_014016 [Blomia tropicalis]
MNDGVVVFMYACVGRLQLNVDKSFEDGQQGLIALKRSTGVPTTRVRHLLRVSPIRIDASIWLVPIYDITSNEMIEMSLPTQSIIDCGFPPHSLHPPFVTNMNEVMTYATVLSDLGRSSRSSSSSSSSWSRNSHYNRYGSYD